jgi:hypothetical protein
MAKMLRIEFGKSSIDIEDDKEVLWKTISDPEFDWNTPLLIKDSTNPMNDLLLNLSKFAVIKRFDNKPKTVADIINE